MVATFLVVRGIGVLRSRAPLLTVKQELQAPTTWTFEEGAK